MRILTHFPRFKEDFSVALVVFRLASICEEALRWVCLKFLSILGSKINLAVTRFQDDSIFVILHPFLNNYKYYSLLSFSQLFQTLTGSKLLSARDPRCSAKCWVGSWAPGSRERGSPRATWMWLHFGRDYQSIFGNAEIKIGWLAFL